MLRDAFILEKLVEMLRVSLLIAPSRVWVLPPPPPFCLFHFFSFPVMVNERAKFENVRP